MNTKTILYAVGAFGAAGLLVLLGKRGVIGTSGEAERMAGVNHWFGTSAGQAAGVSDAVAASNRAALESVFRTQPDFWV